MVVLHLFLPGSGSTAPPSRPQNHAQLVFFFQQLSHHRVVMGRPFVPQRFDAFFSPHQRTHVVFIFGHGFNFHTQLPPPFLTAAFHLLNLQIRQMALQCLVVLPSREKRVLEWARCLQVHVYVNLTSNFNMLFSNISRSWFNSKFFTNPAPCPFRSMSFFFRVNN